MLPKEYRGILTCFIREIIFRGKCEDEYVTKQIKIGIPRGSILRPILYVLFMGVSTTINDTQLATFTDDSAIHSKGVKFKIGATKTQKSPNNITTLAEQIVINLNEQKSAHMNFTYKRNKEQQQ